MSEKNSLPFFDEVSNELGRLGLAVQGAECHGAMCGYLCANHGEDFSYWCSSILSPMASEEAEGDAVLVDISDASTSILKDLFDVTAKQIADVECGLQMLLPDDDEALGDRVEALSMWCQGFLYGLTVVAVQEMSHYSAEGQEVLEDIVKISQTGLDAGEDSEESEVAYAEIVEYVRIGVLLIWSDARHVQTSSDDDQPTLH